MVELITTTVAAASAKHKARRLIGLLLVNAHFGLTPGGLPSLFGSAKMELLISVTGESRWETWWHYQLRADGFSRYPVARRVTCDR